MKIKKSYDRCLQYDRGDDGLPCGTIKEFPGFVPEGWQRWRGFKPLIMP